MCCGNPDWKREVVQDHKFDFIDVREFHDGGCFTRLKFIWVYVLVAKSFLVYGSDLYTAIAMLASNYWSGSILANAGGDKAVQIPFSIGKWIFTGCIIFSFLLLAWEARKARAIIRSRDISYAFTNVMANNYYSMKSYDHFCFFCQINDSKKKKDEFAFFIFFTFKGWKRLLLADAPRQVINGLTLYSFAKAVNFTTDIHAYYDGSFIKAMIIVTMLFTLIVWVGSAILLTIAAFMYVPLLCYIQGNLKEYCCHKVDKRIAELIKRRARKRLAQEAARAKKEARGDFSHLKDKKGNIKGAPLAQPTLPSVGLDDYDDSKSDVYSTVAHNYPPRLNAGNGGTWPPPLAPPSSFGGGYAGSEVGSVRGGYEGSLIGEHLMSRQGYAGGYAGSDYGYSGSGAGHFQGSALNRAPSYKSDNSDLKTPSGGPQDPSAMHPVPHLQPGHPYYGYGTAIGSGSDVGVPPADYEHFQGEVGYAYSEDPREMAGGSAVGGPTSNVGRSLTQTYNAPSREQLFERTQGVNGRSPGQSGDGDDLGFYDEDDPHYRTQGQGQGRVGGGGAGHDRYGGGNGGDGYHAGGDWR